MAVLKVSWCGIIGENDRGHGWLARHGDQLGNAPISVAEHPQPATLVAGARLSLTCAVSGGVAPYDFRWTKDGRPLPARAADDRFQPLVLEERGTLVIRGVAAGDGGDYRCEANGVEGTTALSDIAAVAVTAADDPTGCRTPKCSADEVRRGCHTHRTE